MKGTVDESIEDVDLGRGHVILAPSPFVLDEFGLQADGAQPSLDVCQQLAGQLKRVRGALNYWIGDLVTVTQRAHGEAASQVVDADWLPEKVVAECQFVAEHVGHDQRRIAPSWEHARAVAGLKPAQQVTLLQRALDEDWIASKLKSEVQASEAGGKTALRFLLIVEVKTEAQQEKLAADLTTQGHRVTTRTTQRTVTPAKPHTPRRKKTAAVTARAKRRSRTPRAYARRGKKR